MNGTCSRFLLFLLVLGVPLGFAFLLVAQAGEERAAQHREAITSRWQERLERLCFLAHPTVRCGAAIQSLVEHLAAAGWQPLPADRLPNPFPAGVTAQVGLFTPAGDLWEPAWGKVASRFLWKRLWQDIQRRDVDLRQLERYQRLFGSWLHRHDLTVDGGFQEISTPAGPGYFYLQRGPAQAGIIVYIPRLPGPFERWQTLLASAPPTDLDLWVHDPRSGRVTGTRPLPARERRWLRRAGFDAGWMNLDEDHGYVSRRTDDHLVILGRFRDARPPRGFRPGPWLLLLASLAALLGLFTGGQPLARLGLQTRLLLLFTVSSFLPAFLLLQNGWHLLDETARRLTEEVHEANLERLRAASAALTEGEERQNQVFRRIACQARALARPGGPGPQAFLERARRRRLISSYSLFDRAGNELVGWWGDQEVRDLTSMFAREMLRRYADDTFLQPADTLAWTFFQVIQSPILGFDTISDSPGQARLIDAGTAAQAWWYWDVFPTATGSEPAVAGLLQAIDEVRARVFRRHLPPGVFVYNRMGGTWLPHDPGLPEVDGLLAQAFVGRRSAQAHRDLGGRPHLVSVLPCPTASDLCFLTVADLDPVLRRLDRRRALFGAAAVFTVILAAFLALVISRTLLTPIGQLVEGVNAFARGARRLALPDLGADEIGVLGQAVNDMAREAREVDAARRVQESLIPSRAATVPGYRTALRYLPLDDLAGDYCDTLPRPDGCLFLGIGDVTGHGIAAALQTAMAKAACAQACREGCALPDLFASLNAILHEGRASGRLMTFCGGLLDPHAHTWTWLSAGHTFPLRRGADGSTSMLRHPGLPLGARAHPRWTPSMIDLQPGDCLLFYTDGIVEGLNRHEEPFGYDRLMKALAESRGSPDERLDEILHRFRQFVGDAPLGDDATLLLVVRDP
ncbi:MAG: Serine phosphatase RsbU, regulator of sigma subunit [Candidatus Ozemobacter sibiricus]|jgi:HAMP domain-containing protein|uniref:Serine phosphatase RsbU, regulator of sigma subunit n=1 Tax=Candidatus Ozemobacter sibiricus TaxID=2268124 RepID=A0A367ZK22_9BACT|nr:MAG: Serine phosphatase RsbU, regulator of sigma subunit [Candidatus Ozemobacter sibiricus]